MCWYGALPFPFFVKTRSAFNTYTSNSISLTYFIGKTYFDCIFSFQFVVYNNLICHSYTTAWVLCYKTSKYLWLICSHKGDNSIRRNLNKSSQTHFDAIYWSEISFSISLELNTQVSILDLLSSVLRLLSCQFVCISVRLKTFL